MCVLVQGVGVTPHRLCIVVDLKRSSLSERCHGSRAVLLDYTVCSWHCPEGEGGLNKGWGGGRGGAREGEGSATGPKKITLLWAPCSSPSPQCSPVIHMEWPPKLKQGASTGAPRTLQCTRARVAALAGAHTLYCADTYKNMRSSTSTQDETHTTTHMHTHSRSHGLTHAPYLGAKPQSRHGRVH